GLAALTLVAGTLGASPSANGAVFHPLISPINANQSGNWSGYNQGTLEKTVSATNPKLFTSVAGDWIVPTAAHHNGGPTDQYSSSWIGIGGGCVNSNCLLTDNTLIQAGTEQDVHGSTASYS